MSGRRDLPMQGNESSLLAATRQAAESWDLRRVVSSLLDLVHRRCTLARANGHVQEGVAVLSLKMRESLGCSFQGQTS